MPRTPPPRWRNRIIASGEADPESLLANPLNWRIHPKNQAVALESVVDGIGWVSGIIVNKRTGCVVDGHLRVALALRHHEPTIPVQFIDVSEDEERVILATLDPIAAMAATDKQQLDALLAQTSVEDERIATLLADVRAQEELGVANALNLGSEAVEGFSSGLQFDATAVYEFSARLEPGQRDLVEALTSACDAHKCKYRLKKVG